MAEQTDDDDIFGDLDDFPATEHGGAVGRDIEWLNAHPNAEIDMHMMSPEAIEAVDFGPLSPRNPSMFDRYLASAQGESLASPDAGWLEQAQQLPRAGHRTASSAADEGEDGILPDADEPDTGDAGHGSDSHHLTNAPPYISSEDQSEDLKPPPIDNYNDEIYKDLAADLRKTSAPAGADTKWLESLLRQLPVQYEHSPAVASRSQELFIGIVVAHWRIAGAPDPTNAAAALLEQFYPNIKLSFEKFEEIVKIWKEKGYGQ